MKRLLKIALLLGILTLLLCVSAYAAGPDASGIYDLKVGNHQTFSVEPDGTKQENTTIGTSYTGDFYSGAEKLTVRFGYQNPASYYLALALSDVGEGPATPTASNIRYIDQKPGASTVDFLIYPDKLESGKEYSIYVVGTGDNSLTLVATFKYYQPYTLGDVNEDGFIDADDALLVLRATVHLENLNETQSLAADVTHDGEIDANDALIILRASVGLEDLT